MGYVLSLDGGGTKLDCLVSNEQGSLVGEGKAGPTNSNFNSPDDIRRAIEHAIIQATIQIDRNKVLIVYAALPADHQQVEATIRSVLNQDILVCHRGEFDLSLYGAIQCEYGGLVQAGTGSFAVVRTMPHRRMQEPHFDGDKFDGYYSVGGWGALFGDEGSGFYIGRKALTAFAEMNDGRRNPSLLNDRILDFFGANHPWQVVREVYRVQSGVQRTTVASLCPVVAQCARLGDSMALDILQDASRQMARQMVVALKKAAVSETFTVSVAGGVWKAHPILFHTFREMVTGEFPNVNVVPPLFEPVVGGLLLGLRDVGFPLKENLDLLKKSFQPYLFPRDLLDFNKLTGIDEVS